MKKRKHKDPAAFQKKISDGMKRYWRKRNQTLQAELEAARRQLKWQRDFEQAMAQHQQRMEIVRS